MRPRVVSLIGCPGCGKTTLGFALAALWSWPFFDVDEQVETAEGMCVSQLFARRGEQVFRAAEAEAIGLLTQKEGIILATGGGSVLLPDNVAKLRQAGITVYLQADEALLQTRLKTAAPRPLLPDEAALTQLLQQRLPLYERCADVVFPVTDEEPDVQAENLSRFLRQTYENGL